MWCGNEKTLFPLPILGSFTVALQIKLAKDRLIREKHAYFITVYSVYPWKNSVINNSKGWLELELIQNLNKRTIIFKEVARQGKRNLSFWGDKLWEGKYMGELWKIKAYLVRSAIPLVPSLGF